MTYLEFHLVFLLPALVATAVAARGARAALGRRIAWSIPALAGLALIWTTPWDNYLVATGVWEYGEERVIATIGWVPVEEYLFFILQPFLTGWLFFALARHRTAPPLPAPKPGVRRAVTIAWLAAAAMGLVLVRSTTAGTYFGLILAWAPPVAALQWALGDRHIRRRSLETVMTIGGATLYLCMADAVAIRSGIWSIAPASSTGWHILGLPVEEALFFLLTNVLIVQGLILFLDPPPPFRAD